MNSAIEKQLEAFDRASASGKNVDPATVQRLRQAIADGLVNYNPETDRVALSELGKRQDFAVRSGWIGEA